MYVCMYVCIGNQQHNFFSNVANYMIQHLLHRTIFGLRSFRVLKKGGINRTGGSTYLSTFKKDIDQIKCFRGRLEDFYRLEKIVLPHDISNIQESNKSLLSSS